MEKKKSGGIIIFSIVTILISLGDIAGALNASDYYWIGFGTVLVFFCIFVLMLKNWARIGLITTSIIILLISIYTLITEMIIPKYSPESNIIVIPMFLFGNALYIAIIIYFTRPKVKEQFKPGGPNA